MGNAAEEGFLRLRCPLGGGLQEVGSEPGRLEKSMGASAACRQGDGKEMRSGR